MPISTERAWPAGCSSLAGVDPDRFTAVAALLEVANHEHRLALSAARPGRRRAPGGGCKSRPYEVQLAYVLDQAVRHTSLRAAAGEYGISPHSLAAYRRHLEDLLRGGVRLPHTRRTASSLDDLLAYLGLPHPKIRRSPPPSWKPPPKTGPGQWRRYASRRRGPPRKAWIGALEALAFRTEERDTVDRELAERVASLRAEGYSWRAIGEETRQRWQWLYHRYRHGTPRRPPNWRRHRITATSYYLAIAALVEHASDHGATEAQIANALELTVSGLRHWFPDLRRTPSTSPYAKPPPSKPPPSKPAPSKPPPSKPLPARPATDWKALAEAVRVEDPDAIRRAEKICGDLSLRQALPWMDEGHDPTEASGVAKCGFTPAIWQWICETRGPTSPVAVAESIRRGTLLLPDELGGLIDP